jgi:putative addiction module killer protein
MHSFLIEVRKTAIFSQWMRGLPDHRVGARIAARIDVMALGDAGEVAPVGESNGELRIHLGPRYREYFVLRGKTLIVLLRGGDKSTQTKDIKMAKMLAANLED